MATRKAAAQKTKKPIAEEPSGGRRQRLPSGESITTGVVRLKDLMYFLVSIDELVAKNVSFSRVYELDQDDLGSMDLDWLACSCTVCHEPEERFLAIAQRGGQVCRMGGGEYGFESLSECQEGFVRKPGLMREIREIAGGHAYAVGTGRQVYRRNGPDDWMCIDRWSKVDSKALVDYSFESIDGFAEDDLYAVGWKGEIWHFDGKRWDEVPSPSRLAWHKVKCAPDGQVYIAGKDGLLIRGRGKKWKTLASPEVTADIWGLEWFDGDVWLSTTESLYRLKGERLGLVDYGGGDIPATCYHRSAAPPQPKCSCRPSSGGAALR